MAASRIPANRSPEPAGKVLGELSTAGKTPTEPSWTDTLARSRELRRGVDLLGEMRRRLGGAGTQSQRNSIVQRVLQSDRSEQAQSAAFRAWVEHADGRALESLDNYFQQAASQHRAVLRSERSRDASTAANHAADDRIEERRVEDPRDAASAANHDSDVRGDRSATEEARDDAAARRHAADERRDALERRVLAAADHDSARARNHD